MLDSTPEFNEFYTPAHHALEQERIAQGLCPRCGKKHEAFDFKAEYQKAVESLSKDLSKAIDAEVYKMFFSQIKKEPPTHEQQLHFSRGWNSRTN